MKQFTEDCEFVVKNEDDKFRRNTFKMLDSDKNVVGWFDMSISIMQRPGPQKQNSKKNLNLLTGNQVD